MLKNTHQSYGLIAKLLHWLSALTVIGLFAVGFWMVDLDYYSQWYQTAPHWHKSIGILLLLATIFRIVWRITNQTPQPEISHSTTVKKLSSGAHYLLYIMLLTVMCSGYLISTADGRAIEVFDWFSIPALGTLFENQEDLSGLIHEYVAYTLIGLALLHAIAAIKHHVIDKDNTLRKII